MTAPIRSPVWQPSPARTVIITPPTFIRARGLVQKVMPLSWGMKTSGDNLDYYLDASELLCCTQDYIASVTASVIGSSNGAPDVAVSWCSIVNGMAALFIASGTPGTTQKIQVDMLTQQGRLISQPMLIAITADGALMPPDAVPTLPDGTTVPPNALQAPDGTILLAPRQSAPTMEYQPILSPDGNLFLTDPSGVMILSAHYVPRSTILLCA